MQKNLRSSSEKLDKAKNNTTVTKDTRVQTLDNEKSPNNQINNYYAKYSGIKTRLKILWKHSHRTKRFISITIISLIILIAIIIYNVSSNIYGRNYNNLDIYNTVLLNHVNSIIFVAPIFIFIELAFFEGHYLIDYIDKKENSKELTKILVVVVNLFLAICFSVELMAQQWETIEPIITVCTAVFIPYIAWLLKKYGSEKNKTNPSPADELLKYKELLDRGALTQKEFDDQKTKLLSK